MVRVKKEELYFLLVQIINLDLGEKGAVEVGHLRQNSFHLSSLFKIFKSKNSATGAGNFTENTTAHKEVCVFIPCFSSP